MSFRVTEGGMYTDQQIEIMLAAERNTSPDGMGAVMALVQKLIDDGHLVEIPDDGSTSKQAINENGRSIFDTVGDVIKSGEPKYVRLDDVVYLIESKLQTILLYEMNITNDRDLSKALMHAIVLAQHFDFKLAVKSDIALEVLKK